MLELWKKTLSFIALKILRERKSFTVPHKFKTVIFHVQQGTSYY